jgi:hypothetical protein
MISHSYRISLATRASGHPPVNLGCRLEEHRCNLTCLRAAEFLAVIDGDGGRVRQGDAAGAELKRANAYLQPLNAALGTGDDAGLAVAGFWSQKPPLTCIELGARYWD